MQPSDPVPDPPRVNLKIVSPSVGVQSGLEFDGISVNTTVLELKHRLRDTFPSRPSPSSQRLVFSGRILDDGSDLSTALNYSHNPNSSPSYTIHLVLNDIPGRRPVPAPTSSTSATPTIPRTSSPSERTPSRSPGSGTPPGPSLGPTPTIPSASTTRPAVDAANTHPRPLTGRTDGSASGLPPFTTAFPGVATNLHLPTAPPEPQPLWVVVAEDGTPKAVVIPHNDYNPDADVGSREFELDEVATTVYLPTRSAIRDRLTAQRKQASDTVKNVDSGIVGSLTGRQKAYMWNVLRAHPDRVYEYRPCLHPDRDPRAALGLCSHCLPAGASSHRGPLLGSRFKFGPQTQFGQHTDNGAPAGPTDVPQNNRLPNVRPLPVVVRPNGLARWIGNRGVAAPGQQAAPGAAAAAAAAAGVHNRPRVYHFRISLHHLWYLFRVLVCWYFFSGPLFVLMKNFRHFTWPAVILGTLYLFFWCGVLGEAPQRMYSWYEGVLYGAPESRPYTEILRPAARADGRRRRGGTVGVWRGVRMAVQSVGLTALLWVGSLWPSVQIEMVARQKANQVSGGGDRDGGEGNGDGNGGNGQAVAGAAGAAAGAGGRERVDPQAE